YYNGSKIRRSPRAVEFLCREVLGFQKKKWRYFTRCAKLDAFQKLFWCNDGKRRRCRCFTFWIYQSLFCGFKTYFRSDKTRRRGFSNCNHQLDEHFKRTNICE